MFFLHLQSLRARHESYKNNFFQNRSLKRFIFWTKQGISFFPYWFRNLRPLLLVHICQTTTIEIFFLLYSRKTLITHYKNFLFIIRLQHQNELTTGLPRVPLHPTLHNPRRPGQVHRRQVQVHRRQIQVRWRQDKARGCQSTVLHCRREGTNGA